MGDFSSLLVLYWGTDFLYRNHEKRTSVYTSIHFHMNRWKCQYFMLYTQWPTGRSVIYRKSQDWTLRHSKFVFEFGRVSIMNILKSAIILQDNSGNWTALKSELSILIMNTSIFFSQFLNVFERRFICTCNISIQQYR